MTREQVLEAVRSAFEVARPAQFTDRGHCRECAEHDDTLRAHTPDTISLDELGNPGWDPICCATDEAFVYYLPALARLAYGRGVDAYVDQLVIHLSSRRLERLDRRQLGALRDLLASLAVELPAEDVVDSTAAEIRVMIRDIEGRLATDTEPGSDRIPEADNGPQPTK